MRMIDADKFKDSMKYVCDSGGWLEPVTTAVKEYVVKNIDAQPTVEAIPFKWTPCSERLPEETGTYLVTINYHGNTYVSMDNFSPSGWELTGWTGLATRLAWAKVPEPYKGETE